MMPARSAIPPAAGGREDTDVTPRQRFDPAAWDSVYRDAAPTPSQLLFRRVNREVFQAAKPLVRSGEKWLDLGCGTGELSVRLAMSGARVWGVDHDLAMLRWARHRTDETSSTAFLVSDVRHTPFADCSVDGVIAASLTGCLHRLDPFMQEVARILSPGGHAVISFTNSDSLLLELADYWLREKTKTDVNHARNGCFNRYQSEQVTEVASRTGLHPKSMRHFNCFVDLARWSLPPRPIAHLFERIHLKWIHHRLCRNFVVVFRSEQPELGHAA
jgi:ubiquinone/menaquinone biosynthesis C-methylase UbiE